MILRILQKFLHIAFILIVFATSAQAQYPGGFLGHAAETKAPTQNSALARADGDLIGAIALATEWVSSQSDLLADDAPQLLNARLWLADALLQNNQHIEASQEALAVMKSINPNTQGSMRNYIMAMHIYAEAAHDLNQEQAALNLISDRIFAMAPIEGVEAVELAAFDLQHLATDLRSSRITQLANDRSDDLSRFTPADYARLAYMMPEVTTRRFERLLQSARIAALQSNPMAAQVGRYWADRVPQLLMGFANAAAKDFEAGRITDVNHAIVVVTRVVEASRKLGLPKTRIASKQKVLGHILNQAGRHSEAVATLRDAVAILETEGQTDPILLWDARNVLAAALTDTGSFPEATDLHVRNLELLDASGVFSSLETLKTFTNWAATLNDDRMHQAALHAVEVGLDLLGVLIASGQYDMAVLEPSNLALLYSQVQALTSLGRAGEAFEIAEEIYENHYKNRSTNNLGDLVFAMSFADLLSRNRRFDEALEIYADILPKFEATFGLRSQDLRFLVNGLAATLRQTGRFEKSLEFARWSLSRAREEAGAMAISPPGERDWQRLMLIQIAGFVASLTADMAEAAQDPQEAKAYFEEALSAAQLSATSPLSEQMRQSLLKRSEASNVQDELEQMRRLMAARAALDSTLFDIGSGSNADNLERSRLSQQVGILSQRIAAQYEGFGAFLAPQPASLNEIRMRLAPDQALILLSQIGGHVFAITREDWAIASIPMMAINTDGPIDPQSGMHRSSDRLRAFRTMLEGTASSAPGQATFDRSEAYALFLELFGQEKIAEVIEDKPRWIVVPQGEFLSLPFNTLITKPPRGGDSEIEELRSTSWMVFERQFIVVPSVFNFINGSTISRDWDTRVEYVAFGDPIFDRPSYVSATEIDVSDTVRGNAVSAWGDLKYESHLPKTRDEIRGVTQRFRRGRAAVYLGAEASEANLIKAQTDGLLKSARVVHFATHGKLGHSVPGLREPALILSRPENGPYRISGRDRTSFVEDGILTASEIGQLDLTADWVVLSACDSGQGVESHASHLGSLTSAFFQAGARSVLVSQWKVWDSVAPELVVSTVSSQTINPWDGAAALRRSMRDVLDGKSTLGDQVRPGISTAHPAIWGVLQVLSGG